MAKTVTSVKFSGLSLQIRLDENDAQLLAASARDQFISPHQHARAIIQTYLAGYVGPYVLRRQNDDGHEP